jgi:hypothetical protein
MIVMSCRTDRWQEGIVRGFLHWLGGGHAAFGL